MLLRFIQYTSPSDSGGYRWFAPPEIPEAALNRLLEYLREIDWTNDADEFNGGIVLLPGRDMGVVFRRVKVAAASGSRAKTTTNGLVFSLADARLSGINGIWDLYLLSDPDEYRQGKDIQFSPSPENYPPGLTITELLCSTEDSFCRLVKRDGVFSLRKILSEPVAISKPEPFRTPERDETETKKKRWVKEQLSWTNNPLLVFFTGVMVGVIICLFLFLTMPYYSQYIR